jgi:hypothetical protein
MQYAELDGLFSIWDHLMSADKHGNSSNASKRNHWPCGENSFIVDDGLEYVNVKKEGIEDHQKPYECKSPSTRGIDIDKRTAVSALHWKLRPDE